MPFIQQEYQQLGKKESYAGIIDENEMDLQLVYTHGLL